MLLSWTARNAKDRLFQQFSIAEPSFKVSQNYIKFEGFFFFPNTRGLTLLYMAYLHVRTQTHTFKINRLIISVAKFYLSVLHSI